MTLYNDAISALRNIAFTGVIAGSIMMPHPRVTLKDTYGAEISTRDYIKNNGHTNLVYETGLTTSNVTSNVTEKTINEEMRKIAFQLLSNSKEIEPSFQKIINDNWDLL